MQPCAKSDNCRYLTPAAACIRRCLCFNFACERRYSTQIKVTSLAEDFWSRYNVLYALLIPGLAFRLITCTHIYTSVDCGGQLSYKNPLDLLLGLWACHVKIDPTKKWPPGRLLVAKSGLPGPLLFAKNGPPGPILAAKSGPPLPKMVPPPSLGLGCQSGPPVLCGIQKWTSWQKWSLRKSGEPWCI